MSDEQTIKFTLESQGNVPLIETALAVVHMQQTKFVTMNFFKDAVQKPVFYMDGTGVKDNFPVINGMPWSILIPFQMAIEGSSLRLGLGNIQAGPIFLDYHIHPKIGLVIAHQAADLTARVFVIEGSRKQEVISLKREMQWTDVEKITLDVR